MAARENSQSHRGKHEERRRQAWSLYLAGETSRRAIGRAIGVSHTTVCKYLTAVLAELHEETLETAREVRKVEVARLDAQLRLLWPQVVRGNLKAHELVLRLAERRAKLLGLDSPTAATVTVMSHEDALAELEAMDRADAEAAAAEAVAEAGPARGEGE